MDQFINYDVNAGLSINTFRKPGAAVGDIADLAAAFQSQDENVVCSLEGAKEALTSMDYFQGAEISTETLESIYEFIQDNEQA